MPGFWVSRDGHLKECDLKIGVEGDTKGPLLDSLDPHFCCVSVQASSLGFLGGLSDDCCFNGKIATFIINLGGAPKASPLRRMRSLAPAPKQKGLCGS